jgi:transcription antitermination protein NusB
MARRTKAREVALQMLYQQDLNPDIDAGTVRVMIGEQLREEDLRAFTWKLFTGVMEWRPMLDRRIEQVAQNWTLDRMAPTDRNVLRLGTFEMLYTDTPVRVVIDEAIELARRFGTAQSPQFVNGILDRLIPEDKKGDGRTDEATPSG